MGLVVAPLVRIATTEGAMELGADEQRVMRGNLQALLHNMIGPVADSIRTRRQPPTEIILDVDATDDPTHGQQTLSAYHGYFRQHQYFPLLVFAGATGFPLAAWLRPGTVHASCGAVDAVQVLVQHSRGRIEAHVVQAVAQVEAQPNVINLT